MLIFGIVLTCLSGILLTAFISSRFSWTERIGLSFPLGMTLQTIVMALLDLVHIPLTAASVLTAGAVVFALLLFLVIRYRGIDSLRFTPAMLNDWRQANLLWVLLLVIIAYCEYMNFSKCIFFPPSDRDSLAAFDTLGFVAAHDHTYMRMSLFDADYNPSIHRAGGSIAYAPFVQMSYAYVYLLGAETSKAIPALMYLFFIIAFYGILRRNTGKTLAALATACGPRHTIVATFTGFSNDTVVMQARPLSQYASATPRTDIRTDTEGRLVPLSSLREKWIEAIGKHELPWINLLDTREGRPAEIIDNVYGIGAYPTKILIDPEGRIVDIFVGERPGFSEKLEASLKNRS